MRGEIAKPCLRKMEQRHCERSEAIQSREERLDFFVAYAPRNDVV